MSLGHQLHCSLRIGLIIILLMQAAFQVSAQNYNSGTLSLPGPNNGERFRINYEISGATIADAGKDKLDTLNYMSTSRELNGVLNSDQLKISGTAVISASWPAADLNVKVEDADGNVVKTYTDKIATGGGEMKFNLMVPVSKDKNYRFSIQVLWYANNLFSGEVSGSLAHEEGTITNPPLPPKCDEMRLDLEEGPGSTVIAKVVDICEYQPIDKANLEIRVFHVYNAVQNQWINGQYLDLPPRTTDNGEAIIAIPGPLNPGDMYRVDVYASMEGYLNTPDSSIHVTIPGNTVRTGIYGEVPGPAPVAKVIFDTSNKYSTKNSPTCSISFQINQPYFITYIDTYHWNNGKGTTAGGTISLRSLGGTIYGPWAVETTPGQGGVPNVNWIVHPNIVIPAGSYYIIDSDPSTWSQNSESPCGFTKVEGYPA